MPETTIYHYPRCGKSREALRILQERDEAVRIVEYLTDPPTVAELDRICSDLGLEPQELIRVGEPRFRELGLSMTDRRSRRQWLQILHDDPILIERPIVVKGKRAVIGRPPEKVLEIL